MKPNILFYGDVVPLNRDAHRGLGIDMRPGRFSRFTSSHVIPAVIDEFTAAAMHLPIIFLPGAEAPSACFLVGLRSGKNALVDPQGAWRGDYLPAYVRRHPFIIGEVAGGGESLVCVDAACLSTGEQSVALFDADGKESAALRELMQLSNDYMFAARRTDALGKALAALGLFQSINIDARFETGETLAIHGCLAVDPAKFEALPEDAFLDLRRQGFLPAVYAHLMSLGCIERVRRFS